MPAATSRISGAQCDREAFREVIGHFAYEGGDIALAREVIERHTERSKSIHRRAFAAGR
jgi:hypothetical protein